MVSRPCKRRPQHVAMVERQTLDTTHSQHNETTHQPTTAPPPHHHSTRHLGDLCRSNTDHLTCYDMLTSPITLPNADRLVDGVSRLLGGTRHLDDQRLDELDHPQDHGLEQPGHLDTQSAALVERAFAFVDLCGFTELTTKEGPDVAVEELAAFRYTVRHITRARRVRTAKWLGDGVMIVGISVPHVAAAATELVARGGPRLRARAGMASGPVLLFDGDDYIGRPVNTASRLADRANPGEVVAAHHSENTEVPWIRRKDSRRTQLRGIGTVAVEVLEMHPGTSLPALTPPQVL